MSAFVRRVAAKLRNRLVPGELDRELRKHVLRLESRVQWNEVRLRSLQEAAGRIEARLAAAADVGGIRANEFRVFSQWNEDGILQWLCRHVPLPRRTFVEIGVESYEQANTLFLLSNGGWSGLVIDGDAEHIARIRSSRTYWQHDLEAVHALVTRDNVEKILAERGVRGDVGVLSIDIDGMDYWVWEAIESTSPAIVVVEYNHRFGPSEAVTVPYDERFERRAAHHSLLYFGASLKALCELGARKGYDFVGCESHGVNAFFVRRDLRPDAVPRTTCEEGWVAGSGCEAHDEHGRRVRTTRDEERELVWSLPLVRVGAERVGAARADGAHGDGNARA